MRKIVSGLFISLDGVVEAPDQWHLSYFNDEMGEAVEALLEGSDAMLFGRRTYEEFAAYWPTSTDELADRMNGIPKYVVSNTLTSAEWQNSTLISGDVYKELARLKQQPGKNLGITGSGTLVRSLLREGLLDELHLLVHPIVVGAGKRLFDDGPQVPLRLTGSRTFSTGVLNLTYERADA
ncbi:pyrimidine reductase [Actinomadura rubrobrunea]|uniref:Pyrimidine reductase n=1 Tax=Actinomadura rubrobrunea TaxID=115335 RepID=A0A9W6PYX9_9ACTN|nr:dihydrofolate reductase family protein [Actinomadura rubrobrunea]GLW65726.1 pyrimidine reductase [Actinomadura rubrobrunea]